MNFYSGICFIVIFLYTSANDVHVDNIKGESVSKHWGLLVAGANSYYNYRHQADVCHAYQILKKHGIPDEQIVVMMYDDIAHSQQNPTPGVIINHPLGGNVYEGVPKDYTGDDVTPTNFLNILQGKKTAMNGIGSGKVIESGPNDFIFVNMVDHGAPGLFAFPSGELYASQLNDVLTSMYKKKKYKEMVIYVESCESGSMFSDLLSKDINVYATTASNPTESSYACYYSAKYKTYLGDVYSVKWMEDSDQEDLRLETLQKQFKIVKKETNTSHVQQYGDLDISDNDVDAFQGDDTPDYNLRFHEAPLPQVPLEPVSSESVTLSILKKSGDMQQHAKIVKEHEVILCQMNKIINLSAASNKLAERYLTRRINLTFHKCYETIARKYLSTCRGHAEGQDGFHLRQMYALVNLCQGMVAPHTIEAAIEEVCADDSFCQM